jgi:hypothetical protein
MSGETLHTAGLSGDLGWHEDEHEEHPVTRLATALLVLATGAVWGSLWLLSGLPPLMSVARRVQTGRHIDADHRTTAEDTCTTTQA